jgi:hypothetical protein
LPRDPRSSAKKDLAISIELPRPTSESEVEQHNRAVCQRGAVRVCYRKLCARCDEGEQFAPHDVRRRGLRLVRGYKVLCLTVWLARWRCCNCRYVFTDYPDFRISL